MLTLQSPIEMQRPAILRFGAGEVETLAPWLAATGGRSSSPTGSTPRGSTSSA